MNVIYDCDNKFVSAKTIYELLRNNHILFVETDTETIHFVYDVQMNKGHLEVKTINGWIRPKRILEKEWADGN